MDNHNDQNETPLFEEELEDNVNLNKEEEIEELQGVDDQIEAYNSVKVSLKIKILYSFFLNLSLIVMINLIYFFFILI